MLALTGSHPYRRVVIRFLLRRAILAILVCGTVLVISFTLTHVAGDPAVAIAGPQATSEDVRAIRAAYGLDRPLPVQFRDWVAAAAHGDLGRSYLFRAPVAELVRDRLPVTLTLGAVGIAFALLIALPLGTVAALNEGRLADRVIMQPLADDIEHVRAAADKHGASEVFMNSASPGVISLFQPNQHYVDDDAYLEALAQAMAHEYKAIVDAGLLLQLDSPDLGLGRHMMYRDLDEADYFKRIEQHVEALNASLAGIPADRIRMHVCWGNYEGPHHRDVGLEKILPIVMKAKPQALLFESSNPRHAHEWAVIRDPQTHHSDDKILIPGVLDSTTNFIEHPQLVAQRLGNFIDVVGRERVIAGTDCGFGTFAGFGVVDAEIVYAKFEAMAEGAGIATQKYWK